MAQRCPKYVIHHTQHANKLMHRGPNTPCIQLLLLYTCFHVKDKLHFDSQLSGDNSSVHFVLSLMREIAGLFWDENNLDPADVWKNKIKALRRF